MTKLITVHGTNAGDPNDEGAHWWQKNSPFQKRLAEWINLDGVEIEPFHWDEGANSEIKRRKAGERLLKRLRQIENAGEDYYVIGHSHGGSVIHHALLAASMSRRALPHLRSWISVGTPFICTKPQWLFWRLGNLGKIAFVFMLGAFVSLFSLPINYEYSRSIFKASFKNWAPIGAPVPSNDQIDFTMLFNAVSTPLVAVAIFVFLLISQRHLRQRYAAKTRHFFETNFLTRWRSLRSEQDEAINGLRATTPLRLRLFPKNILVQPAKATIVLLLTLSVLISAVLLAALVYRYGFSKDLVVKSSEFYHRMYFGIYPVMNPADLPDTPDATDIAAALQFAKQNPGFLLGSIAGLIFGVPMLFVVLLLLFGILHVIAYLVGLPLSAFLNRLTADQVRRTAYGNDTIGERVVEVGSAPEGCDASFGLVPAEIETVLTEFSDRNAVKTLASARHILGLNKETQGERDIAAIIAQQMSWHELIHTAYFDVDEFAKLIVYVLHKAGLAPLSERAKSDPGFEKTKRVYERLAPLAVVKPTSPEIVAGGAESGVELSAPAPAQQPVALPTASAV